MNLLLSSVLLLDPPRYNAAPIRWLKERSMELALSGGPHPSKLEGTSMKTVAAKSSPPR
jgi:hypothetical protein